MHLMPANGQNSFTSPTPSAPTHQWWSAVYSLLDAEWWNESLTGASLLLAGAQILLRLNQAGDKIPVCDPETCWHYECHNTEQNKAKPNRTLPRPGYCCHFPIPNHASLESGNTSALKELTLLPAATEEDSSCVSRLWEHEDELLMMWLPTFWSLTAPTREGSVGAQMVLPAEHPPGPRDDTFCARKTTLEKAMGRGRRC